MKKNVMVCGIFAVIFVLLLAFTACSEPSEPEPEPGHYQSLVTYIGYDEDGNSYTLVITKDSDNNTPKSGDMYVLTIKDANGTVIGTSTGTVDTVEDAIFTLKSGEDTFTVEYNGKAIATISDDIPLENGETQSPPSSLKPTNPNSGGINIYSDEYIYQINNG